MVMRDMVTLDVHDANNESKNQLDLAFNNVKPKDKSFDSGQD